MRYDVLNKLYTEFILKLNARGIQTNYKTYIRKQYKNILFKNKEILRGLAEKYKINPLTNLNCVNRYKTQKQLLTELEAKLMLEVRNYRNTELKNIKRKHLHHIKDPFYKDIALYKELLSSNTKRYPNLLKVINNNRIYNHIGAENSTKTGRRVGGTGSINTLDAETTKIFFSGCNYTKIDFKSFEPTIAKHYLSRYKLDATNSIYELIQNILLNKYGLEIDISLVKLSVISFLYGMGSTKMARLLKVSVLVSSHIQTCLSSFFELRGPFIKQLSYLISPNKNVKYKSDIKPTLYQLKNVFIERSHDTLKMHIEGHDYSYENPNLSNIYPSLLLNHLIQGLGAIYMKHLIACIYKKGMLNIVNENHDSIWIDNTMSEYYISKYIKDAMVNIDWAEENGLNSVLNFSIDKL